MPQALTGAIQEGLLALLCYDAASGSVVRNIVPESAYDDYYRRIAVAALAFWANHKRPPGDHTPDLVEALCSRDKSHKTFYSRILRSMLKARPGLNAEYLLQRATVFVRQQRLRSGILKAVDELQADKLDEAETTLTSAMRAVVDCFNPGTKLNTEAALAFLSRERFDSCPTGIPMLDRSAFGPGRKELHLFVALPKRGKTWWLVHLGKQAIRHRLRVVHITLEMSEARVCQRYCQSLFSVALKAGDQPYTKFRMDKLGRVVGLEEAIMKPRPTLDDPQAHARLSKLIRSRLARKPALYIKEFPTGGATVKNVAAYLDSLEAAARFIPDLLLVDYADLFSIDDRYYRFALGRIYKELRGLAVDRNIAVATASQSNREGTRKPLLTDANIAEDYSKIATADTVITYNQTESERARGLARLYVAAARGDGDRIKILISQNYAVGQFCLRSAAMTSAYFDLIDEDAE